MKLSVPIAVFIGIAGISAGAAVIPEAVSLRPLCVMLAVTFALYAIAAILGNR